MRFICSTGFCVNKGGSISDWRSGSILSWRKHCWGIFNGIEKRGEKCRRCEYTHEMGADGNIPGCTSKTIKDCRLSVVHVFPWPDLEHFDYPVSIVHIEDDPVIPDTLVVIGISFTALHISVRIIFDGFYRVDDTRCMGF